MNVISIERRAVAVGAAILGSYRDAAKAANSAPTSIGPLLRQVSEGMTDWKLGLFSQRLPTASAYLEAKRAGARSGRGADRVVAFCTERTSRLFLGYGIGETADAAKARAIEMAQAAVDRLEVLDVFPPDVRHHPKNIGGCADTDSLERLLRFKMTGWNLCASINGATPAQQAGVSTKLWSPTDLLMASLRIGDRIDDRPPLDEPVVAGVPTKTTSRIASVDRWARPPAVLIPPASAPRIDPELARDEEVYRTPYGRLRVIAIEYAVGHKKQRRVRGIEWAICRCECKSIKRIRFNHLKTKTVTGCGCAHLEFVSQGSAPTHVEAFGHTMTLGQLASLAGCKPTTLWARLRRGYSPEEAAVGHGFDEGNESAETTGEP